MDRVMKSIYIFIHLRAYPEVSEPQGPQYAALRLIHRSNSSTFRGEKVDLGPFQTQQVRINEPIYVLRGASTHVLGAVYVLSKGASPTWFQLEVASLVGGFPIGATAGDFHPTLVRKDLERPQVAWTQELFTRFRRG
jgi:hypothetical protein